MLIYASRKKYKDIEVIFIKKVNTVIENAVAKLAYNCAKQSANTACRYWFGQSKFPEAVKKLRKF